MRQQSLFNRRVPGTGWSGWLLVGLIALGLPRTILADLGIVEPESSWVYFVLALTPFAAWFAVAILHRTDSPIRDHLVAGAAYGLSLVIVHETLWSVATSLGHNMPQSVLTWAEQFGSPIRELVPHGYSFAIAMMIGLGVGATAAVVAVVSRLITGRRIDAAQPGTPTRVR